MIKFKKIPDDILNKIKKLPEVLGSDKNIIFGYLFGGLARGQVRPLSDIDIAVYLEDTVGLVEYKMELFEKLSKNLGTDEVDVVILNFSSISLSGRILENKRVLIDRNPFKRHKYESTILREYFDFKIMEDNFFMRRYNIGR